MEVHSEFIFGLGLGLFFAGLLIAATPRISDSEIERRARDLGMVQKDEVLAFDVVSEASSGKNTGDSKQADSQSQKAAPKEGTKSSPDAPLPAPKKSGPAKGSSNSKVVSVTIAPGSTVTTVSRQLQDKGIIEDGDKFLNLVKDRQLSNKLIAGTYQLKEHEDMEKLVNILCGRKGSEN